MSFTVRSQALMFILRICQPFCVELGCLHRRIPGEFWRVYANGRLSVCNTVDIHLNSLAFCDPVSLVEFRPHFSC